MTNFMFLARKEQFVAVVNVRNYLFSETVYEFNSNTTSLSLNYLPDVMFVFLQVITQRFGDAILTILKFTSKLWYIYTVC